MITTFENYSEHDDPEGVYLPSPERISRLCAVIRRGWSDRELHKRSVTKPQRWMTSEVVVCLDATEFLED